MKLTINAKDLSSALTQIKAAVPGRTTLPILETFLFEAVPGSLRITASQVDMEASTTIACDVSEPGRAAISANIFGVVKGLGKGDIAIFVPEKLDARATFTGSRQAYEFGTLPADDFPLMDPIDIGADFEIDAGVLMAALSATIGTIDQGTAGREHLAGVRMFRDGRNLTFFSTDFKRATQYVCTMPDHIEMAGQFTIPQKAASAAISLLTGFEGAVRVRGNASSIAFFAGDARMASRLIAGNYGDYTSYVAKIAAYQTSFRVQRSELSEAIARIIALRAETKAPVVVFKTNGEAVELVSDRRGRNEGKEYVDAEIVEPTEFGVSTTYISGLVGVWPESADLDIAAPVRGGEIVIRSGSIPGLMQIVGQMSL